MSDAVNALQPARPKVVALHDGLRIANPSEPDADVVKAIEDLLTLAKSGELVGIAWAMDYWDKGSGSDVIGRSSPATVGNLFGLANRLSHQIDGE